MSDFEDRLQAMRVEISDEAREAHMRSITRELARRRRSANPRRRVVIAVLAAFLVLQVGVVWAAEDSLPGDALYGLKVAYEAPRSLFDPEVRLRHRVEEAEQMVDSAPERVADAITRADRVVDAEPDPDPTLTRRLDTVRDAEADRTRALEDPPQRDEDRADTPTTSEALRDVTTTSSEVTDQPPGDAPTTSTSSTSTTAPPRQRDTTTTTTPPSDG